MTAVLCVEIFTEIGVFLSEDTPGITDGSEGGITGFGSGSVAFTESFLHGVVGGEERFVLFVAIAAAPGLVEDGLGSGCVDNFIEATGSFLETVGEKCGGLALILKDDKVELAGFNFVDGLFFSEMESEGFPSGVDEGELGVGVRGRFDESDDGFANATGIAVADEEDFFWLRRGWGFGFFLSECRGGQEEDETEEKGGLFGDHCQVVAGMNEITMKMRMDCGRATER